MKQILKTLLAKSFEILLCVYEQGSSVLWFVFLYPIYVMFLKKMGYQKISPFQYSGWHLSCRYLLAYKNNKKCFVKCGKYFLIRNEVTALKTMATVNNTYITQLYDYQLTEHFPINFAVVEFLDVYTPVSDITSLTKEQHVQITLSLNELLKMLALSELVHRDIGPSNVFIKNNDFSSLKLIDFAMAAGVNMLPLNFLIFNKLVYHSLGCQYRPANNTWDDHYSVNKVLHELSHKVV